MDGAAPRAWSGSWVAEVASGVIAFPIAVLSVGPVAGGR